jgi:hypothetical protein
MIRNPRLAIGHLPARGGASGQAEHTPRAAVREGLAGRDG